MQLNRASRSHGRAEASDGHRGQDLQILKAEGCAFLTADDHSIDLLGWRPPERIIEGPPRSGIAGVVQAEHILLVQLNHFPNALNVKRVLDSERELSHQLASRTIRTAPELSVRWAQREATYAALQKGGS